MQRGIMETQSRTIASDPAQIRAKKVEFGVPDNTLIANVSHELRIPLTNLKMRLYLARMEPERIQEHLHMLEQIADRMRLLVEDLTDVARLEHGALPLNKRQTVLHDMIAGVVELQRPEAERKSIQLTYEPPATPIVACVDPNRLIQVVTNLVVNAINYTTEGGEIHVYLRRQRGEIVLQVCDTGIGIPRSLQEKIFEPFFRVGETAVKGSGLGLAICRSIVEAHGGSITVESQPGRGSIFSIRLQEKL